MNDDQPANDKDLIFENTPLQNLKNILSEVDASAQAVSGASFEEEISGTQAKEGVTKTAIQKAIDDLAGLRGQYLSPAAVREIIYELCVKRKGPGQNDLGGPDDPAIVRLETLLKTL